jgi:hypothetical protein
MVSDLDHKGHHRGQTRVMAKRDTTAAQPCGTALRPCTGGLDSNGHYRGQTPEVSRTATRSPLKTGSLATEHVFVGSKAPWFEITDDLPQHDEY